MAGRIATPTPTTNFGILASPKPQPIDFSKITGVPQNLVTKPSGAAATTPQTTSFGYSPLQAAEDVGSLADFAVGQVTPGGLLQHVLPKEASKDFPQTFSGQAYAATSALPKPIAKPVGLLAGIIGDPTNLIGGGEVKAVAKGAKAVEESSILGKVVKAAQGVLGKTEKVAQAELPAIVEARARSLAIPQTHTINTPERQIIRNDIASKLYGTGATNKNARADIVVGLPAAGKSSAIAKPIAGAHGSLIVDSDMAKELLPEYANGIGANAVHPESDAIAYDKILPKALENKDNIVLPLVGKNKDRIKTLIDYLDAEGYNVHLHYNEVSNDEAVKRAITRFNETGRFVDPEYIRSLGSTPGETYDTLSTYGKVKGSSKINNEVPFGQKPKLITERDSGIPLESFDSGKIGREKILGNPQRGGGASSEGVTKTETLSLPKFASFKGDVQAFANEKLNVEHLNISPEAKNIVTKIVEEVKPKIQEKVGRVLSNQETLDLAENSSKILTKAIGRDETLAWQAQMLKSRQALSAMGERGSATADDIKNYIIMRTQAADIGRKLQSMGIGADPKEVTSMQTILDAIRKSGASADEIAKAAEGVDFNDLKQATDFYRKFISPKFTEWLDLLRYNSMLSSPKTHIVNIFSNLTGSSIVTSLEKALTGGLDFLGSKITGAKRTAYAGESGAYLKNYLENTKEAANRFWGVMSGNRPVTNLDTRDIPVAASGVKGAVASTLSYPTRLLEGMDQFFTALTEGGEAGALQYRKSKGVKVGNVESQAENAAKYRLFRQGLFDEKQGPVLDAIDHFTNLIKMSRNSKNPIVSTISKFTVPFVQTPMNIFKQGVEYSPAGFSTMFGAQNKTEQLSKAIMGSAVFAGAAAFVISNRATFSEPTDPAQKAAFRAGGMQAYSIKIGNTWVSYQKLPPAVAFPFAMVAAIYDAQKNKKIDDTTTEQVLSGIANYFSFLADQSYVKTIGDTLAAAKGDESSIAKIASNYPQQLVPFRALGGWLARLSDPTQRKVDTQASFIDQQVQLMMMNIPGLSQKTPARVDAFNNPIPQQNPRFNALSPVSVTEENPQAQEYTKMQDIKNVNKQTTYEGQQTTGHAATEYDKLKMISNPEERKARLKQIATEDPALAKKIIKLAQDEQTQVTPSEDKLLNSPIATRAQYIAQELAKLQTPEEKKALLKNYAAKKVLTQSVLDALVELNQQGR